MCCDKIDATPEFTVGACPKCGYEVDSDGASTEKECCYSPEICNLCHYSPCDDSC